MLLDHPDCLTLMGMASSIKKGESDGEYLQEMSPVYQREMADGIAEISKMREKYRKK